jgi:DNA-binding MarR family transcriptional regulator
VTSAQYILLKTIIVAPGRKTGARLGAILNLDKTSLSRNLKILEKKGLISRDGFCGRRGKTIQVTPRGLDVLAKTKPVWESAHDGFSVPEEVIVYVKDIVTRLHA